MIAEQFLNPVPRPVSNHQGMAPNMMMPYYPMNHNNLGGVINSCATEMGEMMTVPQKKEKIRKIKKRYYYTTSSSNNSDDSSSDEESKKKNNKKRSKKKDS